MKAIAAIFRRMFPRIGFWAAVLAAFAAGGCGFQSPKSIPVLMYHGLAADPGPDVWTVSTEEFRRQVADLKAAGYRTILPADLEKRHRWKLRFVRKPILITFDDGLRSVLTEAEPILREAGFRATAYLILSTIADAPAARLQYRQDDCLVWPEVRDLLARGTFAFGIHSFSHTSDPARQALEVVAPSSGARRAKRPAPTAIPTASRPTSSATPSPPPATARR